MLSENTGTKMSGPASPDYGLPLGGVCLSFALISFVEAYNEHSVGIAILGCLLSVAGAIAYLADFRAKRRDKQNAEQKE
jgi:hypothetical protein